MTAPQFIGVDHSMSAHEHVPCGVQPTVIVERVLKVTVNVRRVELLVMPVICPREEVALGDSESALRAEKTSGVGLRAQTR